MGKTIAVLGNGFNHIFPQENIKLYKKILDNDGLVISEYHPDTKCQSKYFLERNRIVSGLSLGILVIEAIFRSGTSVTAKLAILQNKKVFALPHEIWDSHGVGTNRLIRHGAILITKTEDILKEFDCLKNLTKNLKNIQQLEINNFYIESKKSNTFDSSIKSHFDTNDLTLFNSLFSNISIHSSHSSSVLKKNKLKNESLTYIYDLISAEPISINEICRQTSKPISQISSDLFSLELEGYIKKVEGGYVCTLNK